MRSLLAVFMLLACFPPRLGAQQPNWEEVCFGSSARPEKVFMQYDACPMTLPDSIALTTTPRSSDFIGWFGGTSVDGSELRIALEMPTEPDTIMLAVVEAHCTETTPLPMIIFRCNRNYGGIRSDLPGALLTDSLISAGEQDAYIKVRAENGELVPARFVSQATPDDPQPGILAFNPQRGVQ